MNSAAAAGFEDAAPADELMSGNNMVANLPLLFADGYPTTLAKITEAQLERFIPFMVQCSLGCIQLNMDFEYSEPEWWPENVPFAIPLRRPASIAADDWHEKLREIVIICYSFHKVVYLLRFCNDLAQHQQQYLRFINNQNTTTSLFDRTSNKLLVTFRNENMLYDHKPKASVKKTLMPRQNINAHPNDGDHTEESDHQMVQTTMLEIYLCEYCEAELYSLQACRDHEKACELDDDVIFCGTEILPPAPATPSGRPAALISEQLVRQAHFMHMFGLANESVPIAAAVATSPDTGKSPGKSSGAKMRRMPRRGRAILGLAKCPTIAISSPAGQRLVQTSKSVVSEDYLYERLERTERFCHAPLLGQQNGRKSSIAYMPPHNSNATSNQDSGSSVPTTFRRPAEYSSHVYTFPRRQFSQRSSSEASSLLNGILLRMCKPLIVPLNNLTVAEQDALRRQARRQIATTGRKLTNFQLKQMELRRLRERVLAIAAATVAEASAIIDLCSSGDEDANMDDHRRLDARGDCDGEADDYVANDRTNALPNREEVSLTLYRRRSNDPDRLDPMELVSVVDSTDRRLMNEHPQQRHRYSQHSSNGIQQQQQHQQQSSNSTTPYSLNSLATTNTSSSSTSSSFESVPLSVQRKSIAESLTEAVQSSMLRHRNRQAVDSSTVHRVRNDRRRHRRRQSPLLPHRFDGLNGGGEMTGNGGVGSGGNNGGIGVNDTDDVLIISRMTHTSMTLDSHKQLYNYHQNQDENRYGTSATAGLLTQSNAGPASVTHHQRLHQHRQQLPPHHHLHQPHHNQQLPLPTTLSLNNGTSAAAAASMNGGPDIIGSGNSNGAICSAIELPQSVTLTLLQPQAISQKVANFEQQQQQHTSIDLT